MTEPASTRHAAVADRSLSFTEFVALLAMLFSTIAFSIDAMLPALTVIGEELTPEDVNRAQLIVTIFVLGMGIGTFFTGPLSDAYGRKPVVVAGIAVYIVAALVAATAPSLEVLLAARFVQGLGASAPRVVTLAMVRDLFAGRAMARVMSFVMMVFILVPAVAPSIGALIIDAFSWRAVFLSFVAFGLISGSWLTLRQPETLPPDRRRALRLPALLSALGEVLGSRVVVTYTAALSLGFGQMFAFLSSAPQIFTEVLDRGESFPYWFAGVAAFAGTASVVNAKLVMRLGMRKLATAAFMMQFAVSGVLATALSAGALPYDWLFPAFFAYMCVAFFMVGLTFGNLNALALEPMGHIAGFAAAIVGSVSTILAVAIAIPIGLAYDGTPLPLTVGVTVCSALALVLMLTNAKEAEAEPG